jgi:hypothetical protein
MAERVSDWELELARWLEPFLARLGHKARRRMCPLYIAGLIGPGSGRVFSRWRRAWLPGSMTSCTIS